MSESGTAVVTITGPHKLVIALLVEILHLVSKYGTVRVEIEAK